MQTHHYRNQDARQTFLQLAAGADIESSVHSDQGLNGEIAMYIAIWANREARRAIVLAVMAVYALLVLLG